MMRTRCGNIDEAKTPCWKRPRIAALLVFCAAAVCGDAAWADNLGSLVFLVFIWPAGVICFIILCVSSLMAYRSLSKSGAGRSAGFAIASLVISGVITVIFPLFAVGAARAYYENASAEILVMSIAPVVLIGLLSIVLNAILIRNMRKREA